MQRLLLIGRRNAETIRIRNDLVRGHLDYTVDLADSAPYAITKIKNKELDLLVYSLEVFAKDKIKIATDMRELGYDFPLLVLAKIISPNIYSQLKNLDQTILLEAPYEKKDLSGIAQKLISGNGVAQRVHRRFYTNQLASVEKAGVQDLVVGRIYNLSKGGAYLEYSSSEELKLGDFVKLGISLDKVDRKYTVYAKAVWATEKGMWSGNPGIGLEFVQGGDIYRNLLGKLKAG